MVCEKTRFEGIFAYNEVEKKDREAGQEIIAYLISEEGLTKIMASVGTQSCLERIMKKLISTR